MAAGVNITAMWRGRQQRCQFVHSVASLITFLPHHVNYTCHPALIAFTCCHNTVHPVKGSYLPL